ncbi:hypothetical protein BDN67DRAFT_983863 [Paxillus ammoniavirescens]|nr:hypothetical protein BDN67DRAFT_983863 [Paxillus ammoniavirescens]
MCRQHEHQTNGQGRVERRMEMSEKGRRLNGKADEKVTAATGPGKCAMDHRAGSISLVKPTSSQDDVRGTRLSTPSPPPPSTPNLPVEQPAPTSTQPTNQRCQNGHIPHIEMCCTCEDDEGNLGRVESSSQGGREAVDEDSKDIHVHHAHVEPQMPQSTRQTANNEAADPSNPNTTGAGTAKPGS